MHDEDLYEILQVSRSAEPEVIEAAYKRLARKYHPDTSPLADAEERLKRLNLAYQILGNPALRAAYDRTRLNEDDEDQVDEDQDDEEYRRPQQAPPGSWRPYQHHQYQYPQQIPGPGTSSKGVLSGCLKVLGVATLVAGAAVVRTCLYLAEDSKTARPVETAPERPPPKKVWFNPYEVCVANTEGEGVYLRSLPFASYKKGSAYPEGTKLSVDDERECHPGDEDSSSFCAVEAPDGTSGYVPARYVERCR
ncbi:MAG: DnaJ domain-containing protein [Myxococcales bacterium]|nr:DnaJ domain-containing protein [Myxococcales bacterium]